MELCCKRCGSAKQVQNGLMCTIRTQSARCASRLPFHLPGLGALYQVPEGVTRLGLVGLRQV